MHAYRVIFMQYMSRTFYQISEIFYDSINTTRDKHKSSFTPSIEVETDEFSNSVDILLKASHITLH
jgi:hypothetical protein